MRLSLKKLIALTVWTCLLSYRSDGNFVFSCYYCYIVFIVDIFRSLTDSEASPDRPSISLASNAVSAHQKGHVKSASTSHALPLDLPSTTAASATTTTIEDLIRYSAVSFLFSVTSGMYDVIHTPLFEVLSSQRRVGLSIDVCC